MKNNILLNSFSSQVYRCGKMTSGLHGKFHTPGFPKNYRDFLHCTWTISVDEGFYIKLLFTVFDVEYYPNCSYDYLRLIEQGKIMGTYCGTFQQRHAISDWKSKGNRIQLVFHSDYSNEKNFRGFEVHYRAVGKLLLLDISINRRSLYNYYCSMWRYNDNSSTHFLKYKQDMIHIHFLIKITFQIDVLFHCHCQ